MKKILGVAALVLLTGAAFAQAVTAEYKSVSGQLFLRPTAGGSALFKAAGIDYDVWLPASREVSTIASGSTVTIEGVFTSNRSQPLAAPVVHPYKITLRGKVIDLSGLYGRSAQTANGADVLTAASAGPGPGPGMGRAAGSVASRDKRPNRRWENERNDND